MHYFLGQLLVGARNRGAEGWTQILVFVVLAVVYALGSILKARSNKVEQEKLQGRKPPPIPPERGRELQKQPLRQAGRPIERAERREYQPQVQPAPRKVMRPKPAAEKQRIVRQPLKAPEVPEFSFESPQLETGIEELPDYTSKTVKRLGAERLGLAAKAPKVEDVSEPVLDYADMDALRRAILHYEILGRPLSLRDPSERIIGM